MLRVVVTSALIVQLLAVAAAQQQDASVSKTADETALTGEDATQRFDFHAVRGRKSRSTASGRFEGETHFAIAGKSRVQGMQHYGDQWSGGAHLLWDGVVGDSMATSFELDDGGVFDITIQLTVAPDYGLFDLTLNDTVLAESIDLYGTSVALARPVQLRDVHLKTGRQTLNFRLAGSHPNAVRFQNTGYLMGLDFVQLVRKNIPDANPPQNTTAAGSAAVAANPQAIEDAMPFPAFTAALKQHCYRCHSDEMIEGEINLAGLNSRDRLLTEIESVRRIRNMIARRQMPPPDELQPTIALRDKLVVVLDAVIDDYLREHHAAAPVVMRRMNRYEYNNAVRDLLQLKGDIYPLPEKTIRADSPYFDPASGRFPDAVQVGNRTLGKNQVERQILTGVSPFAIDLQAEGGFNNRGRQLSISPILLESFLKLGRSIVNSPEFDGYCNLTSTFLTAPADVSPEQQEHIVRERLSWFLERAFRRRIDQPTLDRYQQFFVRQLREHGSFEHSMKAVVAAVLASPSFIYIAEAAADTHDPMLDAWELATRLSFFLWSSIPDDQLLAAARDGSLTDPDVLNAQVTRMLEDPRSQALSLNFARQWLRLDQLITAVPDFDRFPTYYSRIGCEQWKFGLQTMVEPLLLFESILVEDRSIMLLVDCNYSYRSDELQSWYEDQVPFAGRDNRNRFNTAQQAFRRRALNDRREGGVLTSAATLTMTSSPLRTKPITRGAWVATVIFNQPPPPPPDVIPEIEADDQAIEAQGLTLRQRLVEHQVNQSCVACHAKIDPLGFALENYDAVGRWRDTYKSGLEIDASGELYGAVPFNSVVELKDALLAHPEWFMRAFCEHMLSYALSRELELSDAPAVDQMLTRVEEDHGQFSTVIHQIVNTRAFRGRSPQNRE